MTDLENRLRHELRIYSERIGPQPVRPLRVPASRRARRTVRWLAPVTAAAAVVGIVAGVSLTSSPPIVPPRPPALTSPDAGSTPAFYLAVDQVELAHSVGNVAIVRDAATGAVLMKRNLPTLADPSGGAQSPWITAAADGQTFVVAEQEFVSTGHPRSAGNILSYRGSRDRFYLLRVAADGRSASLTSLRVSLPAGVSVDDIALSPDGSQLAVAMEACTSAKACSYDGIRVVALAGGAVRDWTTSQPGAAQNLSWAGNAQLAFSWQGRTSPAGYRVLSVAGAGGNLMTSHPVTSPAATPTGSVPAALITADGSAFITTEVQNVPDGTGHVTVVAKIVELSIRTGRQQVLYTASKSGLTPGSQGSAGDYDQGCQVVALAPAGVHALAECFGFGRLDGATFTPLPGVPSYTATQLPGPYISGSATW